MHVANPPDMGPQDTIGVTESTVYLWETNRAQPQTQFVPGIINFLGYAPYKPNWSFGQRLKAIRFASGLSQEQFAKRIGIDESTVAAWEREEHKPSRKKWEDVKTFLR